MCITQKIIFAQNMVRMKNVASGCDQCVWSVGLVAGCGHWVEHSMMDAAFQVAQWIIYIYRNQGF